MKIKLAYSKPVYRRPHRSFFLCGGWGVGGVGVCAQATSVNYWNKS